MSLDINKKALPPPPRLHRWLVLAIISWAMFGNYYIFDALNPVGPLLESQVGFSQSQIGLLDSAYNIAALIILLISGVIIDRAGTRKAMVIFGVIASLGGVLIALAPGGYRGMMGGRFLLGLGAEPLIVAITCALAKWFKGKELSFAMGLNLTIARLGSVAADNSRNWAGSLFSSWPPASGRCALSPPWLTPSSSGAPSDGSPSAAPGPPTSSSSPTFCVSARNTGGWSGCA